MGGREDSKKLLRIATRGSRLALWQAEHVRDRLMALHPGLAVELVAMKTTGDKILDAPLAKIGGKGLFVKELEQAMLEGRADLAVHSMKDVPVELPDGLHIACVLAREDPRDSLLARSGGGLASLPPGAIVGTSSLRRRSQLRLLRPDLDLRDLRGNVNTRLAKLARGEFDAIVLACAGLKRLALDGRITERFSTSDMLPAIGQGIIGIECRAGDARVEALIAPLADPDARDAIAAERALNAMLHGGCQVPIAGHAVIDGARLKIAGLVASLDGGECIRAEAEGGRGEAAALGSRVGRMLLERGAQRILDQIQAP
ncbi:MAG TPA: hydroxymethylbilane synthase [Gammaproteobacteria bacterium]|nr:hydroxymethylbilane synthase [Gammaproteobacteria bacterium]